MSGESADQEGTSVIVVARHGERLDYVSRDSGDGTNWVASAPRPYDPPLTDHGAEQAGKLGKHLATELEALGFPAVSAIYSSPFLRCRQTALGARRDGPSVPLRVELGLAESINEQWYRSWSLPGSDGTWGFRVNGRKAYDPDAVHPLAKRPVQSLLNDYQSDKLFDQTYGSQTSITEPYCFHPAHFETSLEQRLRMKQVVDKVSQAGRTVMLVSHGGPVTHLYEELTRQPWTVHGESTYCCYSIYKSANGCAAWEAVQVNQSEYLNEVLDTIKYVSDADP